MGQLLSSYFQSKISHGRRQNCGNKSLPALYQHNITDLLADIMLMIGLPLCHGTRGTVYPKEEEHEYSVYARIGILTNAQLAMESCKGSLLNYSCFGGQR